ncbi:hypothetical protein [Maribacter sp. R77961]|uniref:hypothetical protein n=1 Tax=Maribacter sp. R77961 TaxID=3093871 RepID=UPI0037CAE8BB
MKPSKILALLMVLPFFWSCGEMTSKSHQKTPAENQKKSKQKPTEYQPQDSTTKKPFKKVKKQKSKDTLKPLIADDSSLPAESKELKLISK